MAKAEWLAPVLSDALALVYQNFLLEEDAAVLEASGKLWRRLLVCAPDDILVSAASGERVLGWSQLAATAPGTRLDSRLMVTASGSGTSQPGQPCAKRMRLQVLHE